MDSIINLLFYRGEDLGAIDFGVIIIFRIKIFGVIFNSVFLNFIGAGLITFYILIEYIYFLSFRYIYSRLFDGKLDL